MSQKDNELEAAKANISRVLTNIEKQRIFVEAMETLIAHGRKVSEVTVDEMMDLVGYFNGITREDIEEYLRAGRPAQQSEANDE